MSNAGSSRQRRRLTDGVFGFEEIGEGDWFRTDAVTITGDHIARFADLTGDRFEVHMDDDAARRLGFPKRIAHGLLVLSMVDGLKNQAGSRFQAVASLGWSWRFQAPVFIGDSLAAIITVTGKRPTRHDDRGILFLDFNVVNQAGETVQAGENQLLVRTTGSAENVNLT